MEIILEKFEYQYKTKEECVVAQGKASFIAIKVKKMSFTYGKMRLGGADNEWRKR